MRNSDYLKAITESSDAKAMNTLKYFPLSLIPWALKASLSRGQKHMESLELGD